MLDFLIGIPGAILRFCNSLTGNYVIALFLFAVIVEIVLLPFSIKQQKNQIRQAQLRPKEMAIRNKYKGRDDKATQQKVQNEIMEMYQRENFNPMQGCLPLLIQLPIIMALYNVVINPLRYICGLSAETITALNAYIPTLEGYADFAARGNETIKQLNIIRQLGVDAFASVEGFAEKITSIDDLPNFDFFGLLNLAETPDFRVFNWLLIIPVLTFAVAFFSSRITRKFTYQATTAENDKQAGCSNAMMDFMMPAMSVYITFIVPGAIGVYWMFKNIVTVIKQVIISKIMPIPKVTEEEIRAAEKEVNLSNRQRKKQEKVRSLHHIDDEEPEAPAAEKKPAEEKPAEAGPIAPAPLKEDNPEHRNQKKN